MGIELVQFQDDDYLSVLGMMAGTNWTRVYTQVYQSGFGYWTPESLVEYVYAYSEVDGIYYDASVNRFVSLEERCSERTIYTPHYFDYTWRKEKAAFGYECGIPQNEVTGEICYYYEGEKVLTHLENF